MYSVILTILKLSIEEEFQGHVKGRSLIHNKLIEITLAQKLQILKVDIIISMKYY